MNKKVFKYTHPAVIAVWAAVVAAGYLVPTFPILGTGSHFTFANILNPLSGIFFGPIVGALCSAIGGFVGFFIAPVKPMLGPVSFVIGMTTAFTAGCIAWGKWPPVSVRENGNFVFNGAIIVYVIGTVLWFTQEIGRSVISIPVIYYGLGFAAVIIGIIFARRLFSYKSNFINLPAFWLCSFGGLIGGATIGNYLSLVLFKQPNEVWTALTVIAPIERMIFALAAMFVGVPLLAGLNKIGIFVGPQDRESINHEDEEGATRSN
ncbi:MAG: hypothetical protein FWD24_02005 [Treponema sp.]|nr:hypothetical protein [Treponema sp.]